jgi:hypothetical protein
MSARLAILLRNTGALNCETRLIHRATWNKYSRKFGALVLTVGAALAVTGPEQPPLLLPVPDCIRKLAVLLVPASVGFVKAASLSRSKARTRFLTPVNTHDMERITQPW